MIDKGSATSTGWVALGALDSLAGRRFCPFGGSGSRPSSPASLRRPSPPGAWAAPHACSGALAVRQKFLAQRRLHPHPPRREGGKFLTDLPVPRLHPLLIFPSPLGDPSPRGPSARATNRIRSWKFIVPILPVGKPRPRKFSAWRRDAPCWAAGHRLCFFSWPLRVPGILGARARVPTGGGDQRAELFLPVPDAPWPRAEGHSASWPPSPGAVTHPSAGGQGRAPGEGAGPEPCRASARGLNPGFREPRLGAGQPASVWARS
uniref:Uncharacterized protein LOC110201721 n=1 Tax=Phascolarctos cinereus TaxID=38626 RepID=A0A6P5JG23_PHACI|nr:uncharacterized protein LOC110201721 [Phascolarctos cinereus]XP_020833222.1 uncharacterized protein LOC110201721 [Phascolarctos cinereus]